MKLFEFVCNNSPWAEFPKDLITWTNCNFFLCFRPYTRHHVIALSKAYQCKVLTTTKLPHRVLTQVLPAYNAW